MILDRNPGIPLTPSASALVTEEVTSLPGDGTGIDLGSETGLPMRGIAGLGGLGVARVWGFRTGRDVGAMPLGFPMRDMLEPNPDLSGRMFIP